MDGCPKCGKPHLTWHKHPSCTSHNQAGEPCGKPPLKGMKVCGFHGGSSRHAKAAAVRRSQEAEAAKAVKTLGLPRDISPTEALLDEVRWTAGHVQWLRAKVQELEDATEELIGITHTSHPLVWGVASSTDKQASEFTGVDTVHLAAPSIWYQLYLKERQHLAQVASMAIKAGVEERRVRLAETQGDLVAVALGKILEGLLAALINAGMSELLRSVWEQQVPIIVPRELRAVAEGSPM